MPSAVQPAFAALWNLDLAMADVVATSSDPALGAIRLAWWRERLEELDGGVIPAEPRLLGVSEHLLKRGITGVELSELENAWVALLDALPWGDRQADALKRRGRILFGIGARLLGGDPAEAEAAGAIWSLADAANHCSDAESRDFLTTQAGGTEQPRKAPTELRPLTVLAALAVHDTQKKTGGIRRAAAAVAHRLRGTFPRQS